MYEQYEKLRNEKGVTDYRVAIETGIPKSTFTDWRQNRSQPKVEKLKKLAAYFEVPIEKLL